MKNPLRKRLPRELKTEFGKYLVIFLLLVATIGLVSGFLVADGSMIIAYNEGFEKYNVENGNFLLEKRANKAQMKAIEAAGVTLYENFYTEEALTNESTMRIFKNRQEVNTVCLMKGELPTQADEIAIDRMYAENNSLEIGDTIESADGKYSWKITGYVALPDYSCLFSDNNDTMFDAVKFGVGIVAPEGYTALEEEEQNYSYSWKYEKEPSDELQEKEMAEDLMDIIKNEAKLKTYIPRYLNQAITFTGEDMGSDQAMMTENPVVVCLSAVDMSSCEAQLEAAQEDGIPVVMLDSGVESDDDLVYAYCGTDNKAAGEEAAKQLCEAIGDAGEVAVMSHTQLSQSSKDRVEGFQEEITKNHPNVSVVSVDYQPSKDDDPTEEESIEAVLEKYPDLKGYYATNQATSEAVLSVLDKHTDRSVQMIGVDMGDTQKKAIEDGKEVGSVCQNPYGMGYATIVAGARASLGLESDKKIDSGFQWIDKNTIGLEEYARYLY